MSYATRLHIINFNDTIDSNKLERINEVSDLVVAFDSKQTFTLHIQKMVTDSFGIHLPQ